MDSLTANTRLVRAKEFYTRLGISKSRFYTCIRSGSLPKPIKVSNKYTVWPETQVDSIIAGISNGEVRL